MLPNPLHPAVVHFPIVLMFLFPVFAVVALWSIRRGVSALRAWSFPVALSVLLAASSAAAVKSGENESERVERVVNERPLGGHEETAEIFLGLSVGLVVVSAVGLARGALGTLGRVVATAGAFAVLYVGVRTGHSGGQLVYRYGAASAYTAPSGVSAAEPDHER